jgi:hypothetical protein
MPNLTKEQFINEYLELNNSYLKAKEENCFSFRRAYDFKLKLSNLAYKITKKHGIDYDEVFQIFDNPHSDILEVNDNTLTKEQLIKKYYVLKEAFLKEKEVNFINHEPLRFESDLSDLMGRIEHKYNLNTIEKYGKWCRENIEYPYLNPFYD